MNELTMAYGLMAAIAVGFWLWTKTPSGKKWMKGV